MKRQRSLQMAQNQSHQVLWCSGIKANQDVSIRLVTNERVTSLCSRGTLAELKVHSSELKTCSKYFEACLSERWTNPNSSSKEFNLEMLHGLEVACYEECFSRMYMPFRKHFKDVKSSVELLRVASQIEYHELISSICGYLAGIKWSVEDELRIRQYSSSQDFARSQAKGLVARLALDGPNKEDDHRVVSELMEKVIRITLCRDVHGVHGHILRVDNARFLFEELLSSIGHNVSDPSFERNMVMVVNKVAKELLVDFHEECRKEAAIEERLAQRVPKFGEKLGAICWILKNLLRAQVAEEVVECFMHLELQPLILQCAIGSRVLVNNAYAIEFASLVLLIHKEAVAGNLVLGIPERITLLEKWHLIYSFDELSNKYEVLYHFGFKQAMDNEILVLPIEEQVEFIRQAREDVFLTLPFQQQMELVERGITFVTPNSLATVLKRKWSAAA